MGFFKKITRPIRKIAKKIIPKEIRPALPYLAAFYGGPGMAGSSFMSGIGNATLRNAISKGLIAGATAGATDEDANILRTTALAAAPDAISGVLGKLGEGSGTIADFVNKTKVLKDGTETISLVDRAASIANPETAGGIAKLIGAQTAVDQTAKFAELNQAEIDKYNANLLSSGMNSKSDRRNAIYQIYINTGAYEPTEINSMLDKYGYAKGGIASLKSGYESGGTVTITQEEYDRLKGAEGMDYANQGLEIISKKVEPVPMLSLARGGEVEVEEQVDDLGIMDLMRDQGVEYGEQVSNAQNDELLEKLFEEFIDLGFSPEDAAKKAREAFDDMSQGQGIEGTQVASGYRDPMLVEMYQQYVFEQEELGVRPMSFEDFKAQATSGMAHGGSVHHARRMAGGGQVNYEAKIKELMDKGLSRPMAEALVMSELSPDAYEILDVDKKAGGGIMNRNLLNTGMDKDMRGGGFIPEGTKEKADDVPARLSKNEFVMTADAVKAAGGGSVNKGAQKMYDIMHQLEAKV